MSHVSTRFCSGLRVPCSLSCRRPRRRLAGSRVVRAIIYCTLWCVCLSASAAGSATAAPHGLRAAMEFGANIVPDDTDPASSLGIGLGGVLGHRWLAEDLRIEPEAKLAFVSAGAPSALALLGGLRLGIDIWGHPSLYGHIGGALGGLRGVAWETGLAVELEIGSMQLGLFSSVNSASEINASDQSGPRRWVQLGVRAGSFLSREEGRRE